MDIFQAIIIGIIEGFTEFLPISSTGHMIVASRFLGVEESELVKAYEVIIQFAAILAVMLIYRDKLSLKQTLLWQKLIVAFLPLGAIGFVLRHQIKALFSVPVVAWMFIIGGIAFLILEYFYKEKDHHVSDVEEISYKQAAWIGVAQMFALIPGTSRAGSTIVGALIVGLTRKAAAEFSFLLAVPVMAATSGYDLLKHYDKFSQKYIGGFAKLLRIDDIKKELQNIFKKQVDFIPDSNKTIMKGLIYV
jgi:undecaprenyl-diphosphatase